MSDVEITRNNEAVINAVLGRVSFAIWAQAPDTAVEWFAEEMDRLIERHGKGLAHLPILDPGAPPFSTPTRKGLMKVIEDRVEQIDVVCPILTATGFRGASIRAMAGGMLMLLPKSRTDVRVAAAAADAASILSTRLKDHDPPLTEENLARAIAEMRKQWVVQKDAAA